MKEFLSSKINKAIVTEANLHYIGSITIDEDLMEKAGIHENEKVLVVDDTNGARLETYVIKGKRGSGIICMNGAAAHLMHIGDELIIMGFELAEKSVPVKNIVVDEKNRFLYYVGQETHQMNK